MSRPYAPIVLALLTLATVSVPAQQGPPPGSPPPGPGRMHLEHVLEAIDLTSQQDAQIRPLLNARHEAGDASRPAVETARWALGEQVRSATFDETAIRTAASAVAALEADRVVADAALLRDVRAALTAPQRAKLDRLMEPPTPTAGAAGGRRP